MVAVFSGLKMSKVEQKIKTLTTMDPPPDVILIHCGGNDARGGGGAGRKGHACLKSEQSRVIKVTILVDSLIVFLNMHIQSSFTSKDDF